MNPQQQDASRIVTDAIASRISAGRGITWENTLDDLGLDSLDVVDLAMEIERTCDVEIVLDFPTVWNLNSTVAEITADLQTLINAKPAPAEGTSQNAAGDTACAGRSEEQPISDANPKPTPPYAENGIGTRLSNAALEYLKDYAFSPEEFVSDHEPTEFEMLMFKDFLAGLGAETDYATAIRDAQDAINTVTTLTAERNRLTEALQKAESFMAGFEGDELQDGIDERLAAIRAALAQAGVTK